VSAEHDLKRESFHLESSSLCTDLYTAVPHRVNASLPVTHFYSFLFLYTRYSVLRGCGVYTPNIPCYGVVEFILPILPVTGLWSYLHIINPCYVVVAFILPIFPVTGLWSYLHIINPCYGVVAFILPIFPVTGLWSLYCQYSLLQGCGVYTPDIPCYGVVEFILPISPVTGLWNLYSQYSLLWRCGVYTPDIPCYRVVELSPHY